eukprot:Clim_evm44s25 gene=Clim_evmTU44s25
MLRRRKRTTTDREQKDQSSYVVTKKQKASVSLTQQVFGKSKGENVDIRKTLQAVIVPEESKKETSEIVPAWHDSDDDEDIIDINTVAGRRKLRKNEGEKVVTGIQYEGRLRVLYKQLHPQPAWAQLRDGVNKYSGTMSTITEGLKRVSELSTDRLNVSRLGDLELQLDVVAKSLSFNPHSRMLAVGSLDRHVRVFEIDGLHNRMLFSVKVADLPIHKIAFHRTGREIIISGRRPHFYVLQMATGAVSKVSQVLGAQDEITTLENYSTSRNGRFIAWTGSEGAIYVLNGRSKQHLDTLRIQGQVRTICFNQDSSLLFAAGTAGKVFVFDTKTLKCVHTFQDQGSAFGGANVSAIAVDPKNETICIGSDSGVVNIYDLDVVLVEKNPSPRKSLMNLTTCIAGIVYSPDGRIAVFWSKERKDSLRCLHTASGTVFGNWPTAKTPLGYVADVVFSCNGGILCIGNAKGKVLLYRLKDWSEI